MTDFPKMTIATGDVDGEMVARLFDFRPLAISFVILLGGIVALCIIATEIAKMLLYGKA